MGETGDVATGTLTLEDGSLVVKWRSQLANEYPRRRGHIRRPMSRLRRLCLMYCN